MPQIKHEPDDDQFVVFSRRFRYGKVSTRMRRLVIFLGVVSFILAPVVYVLTGEPGAWGLITISLIGVVGSVALYRDCLGYNTMQEALLAAKAFVREVELAEELLKD